MARKRMLPQPGPDGILRTGIYQRYVGDPQKNPNRPTAKNLKAWFDAVSGPVDGYLTALRSDLAKIIRPYVDGPLASDEIREPVGRACHSFDLGDGHKLYRFNAELEHQEQWVIDRFRDAVAAMGEIRRIEGNLAPKGQATILFQATFRLGQLSERIQIRPNEPLVKSELGRREGARNAIKVVNEAHDELRARYQGEVDRLMADGYSYTSACRLVASSHGVSERTVRDNTKNPAPRNRGRWPQVGKR